MNAIHIEKSMEKSIDFSSGRKGGHTFERAGSTITAAAQVTSDHMVLYSSFTLFISPALLLSFYPDEKSMDFSIDFSMCITFIINAMYSYCDALNVNMDNS